MVAYQISQVVIYGKSPQPTNSEAPRLPFLPSLRC
jgi:hypothetical protein